MNDIQPLLVPKLTFDTAEFPSDERLDAWHDNMGAFFDTSAPDGTLQKGEMLARIDACNLSGAVFGVTSAPTQRFERSTRRIAQDQMEHFLIQVFLQGGGTTVDGETILAGDMLVIDLAQPHCMVNTDFSNLTLVLPRETCPALSDRLTRLHARRLSHDNAMVHFLTAHLRALWDSVPEMTLHESGAAFSGTVGLMDAWLTVNKQLDDDLSPAVSTALAKEIFRYIEGHLKEPLTPEHLCGMFRISRSQLYRIFRPHEGVSRYVWERRMARSSRMLSSPAYLSWNVSTIAFECGFTSEPHFSRSFKARFGITPTLFRRETLNNAAARWADENQSDNRQRFSMWIRDL